MTADDPADRLEPRVPFFAPVAVTRLSRCWATNISSGGLGLTGFIGTAAPPERGDELELELVLGESKSAIRAIGRVAWTTLVRPDGRLGLGVQFHEISASARTALAMFLAHHRPRALVALASPEELELATAALGDLTIEAVDEPQALDEELLRSSSSIVVFCHDIDRLVAFLDAMAERAGASPVPVDVPLAPVTLCTSIDSDRLLPLFTEGRIYQALRPPVDRRALRMAVERSCERWAIQVELRWASLQLEGMATARQHARDNTTDPESPRHASNVVRESVAMKKVYDLIATVAGHDVPVLLMGETGTGKELAAREIHALSKRVHMPFIAQDCGALTETLLESELFGHVRGAFTGATTDHPGLFRIADGGTIFLDEIQNTSPGLQAKLLRVVEQGEVRPVGAPKPMRVNVRLIAACNIDLRQSIKDGRFRADFFYRLNRFPIALPPLREHVEDILPLTRFFVTMLCDGMERKPPRLDPRVERTLVAYDWPGNIRELKNTIERALLLTPTDEPVHVETLPAEVRAGTDASVAAADRGLDAQVEEFERKVIQAALDRNENVVRRAARELAVNPVTLSRKMRKLGLI
ncbi:MAG TPA: sigma 54-interacting transcriptional regulator [Kofleriaceae bacterium]